MTHENQLEDKVKTLKLLQIYSQPYEHGDARIVGNTEGLKTLRDAIDDALYNAGRGNGDARTPDIGGVFASDGEGYQVKVESNNDHWGLDADGKFDRTTFWNDPARSEPHYCDKGYQIDDSHLDPETKAGLREEGRKEGYEESSKRAIEMAVFNIPYIVPFTKAPARLVGIVIPEEK